MTAYADARESVLRDDDRASLAVLLGERARFDEPVAPHTSWKVGGPADALLALETADELAAVLRLVQRRALPWLVLGSGSNVLVGDGGIRGIVVRLGGEFARIAVTREGTTVVVTAGASSSLPLVVTQAASAGADGIDALAGIPGSVGGALRMNAGTDRETGEFVRDVWVQTPTKPEPHPVTPQYFYRHTTLAQDAVVARATLAFPYAEPALVRQRTQARLVRRKQSQPLQYPNAGSCFRNPPGARAGALIEAAGAKGWREGGAEVSELHANFIVNRAQASAADIAGLLARIRRAVAETSGIELELEVHFVGVFV
ncbi:MAG: UDP-N-acetylmuramate dehydrogenase [Candidatus Eremiobacteraeota bacterium]|nr:UDP-N-acetylmuramate dehydrogenase [Candidatus Eremiobacteraeota bacterium]MBC5803482.1 UDP-N-acetylmuramate dehydrogenase [Candidatus Eremiobacteraeota bacterium]MBC5820472.1 UDP-N-acetylmuramate dehydrogenase [Candidatus Eremiobacteraeota bacterium]